MEAKVGRFLGGLGLALMLTGCGVGPEGPMTITPRFTPTGRNEASTVSGSGVPITLLPIVDKRADTETIGKNSEDSPPIAIKASSAEVTTLVMTALTRQLTAAGYTMAPSSAVNLNVELTQFFVDEGNIYRGTVVLKVNVVKDGATTTFVVTGSAKRWGASLSEANYNEVLSDCLVNAAQDLVKAPGFQAAVAGLPDPEEPKAAPEAGPSAVQLAAPAH